MKFCLALLAVSLLPVCSSSTLRAAETEITDQAISDHIEDELLFDTAVMASNIDITTNDRITTLTGTVDHILAKDRAAKLAQTVKGVRTVINRIDVRPFANRTDKQIREEIETALLMDPATESYEVTVKVEDGNATLTGTVESWQEQELVSKVVKGVRGVTAVQNDLNVNYTADRSDAEIKREIKKALEWNAYIDYWTAINVEVEDRMVSLDGTVGSVAEKNAAEAIAWVNGVEDVEAANLEVKDWAQDPQERDATYPQVSDSAIENAVEQALLYDPRVNSFNVDVDVAFGGVTLRGDVDNLQAKRAAAQVARNTYGVKTIYNRLKVRYTNPTPDKKLAQRIRDALIRDPYTERYDVTVSVTNGIADLYGSVDTFFEKSRVEDVASRVKGVSFVDNNVVVDTDYDPYVYDPYVDEYDLYDYDLKQYDYQPLTLTETNEEIEESIKDEMWWSPFIDADQVDVSVSGGTATLSGEVDSVTEKQAAAENAIEGGATSVVNNLVVQY